MIEYLMGLVAALLATLLIGLLLVFRGRNRADRMMSAQLFGTTGVAILLVWSVAADRPALMDVALVLAGLAPVTAVAFVHLAGGRTT